MSRNIVVTPEVYKVVVRNKASDRLFATNPHTQNS